MRYIAKALIISAVYCIILAAAPMAQAGGNLVKNPDFSETNETGGVAFWHSDMDWATRTVWEHNSKFVHIKKRKGTQKDVAVIETKRGDGETVFHSSPIPYEPGSKYSFSVKMFNEGTDPRVYVRGYTWKRGVRPYPNPHIGDLIQVIAGKPVEPTGRNWKVTSQTFPFENKGGQSDLAKKHYKKVRFMVVWVVIPKGTGTPGGVLYLDDVVVKKK